MNKHGQPVGKTIKELGNFLGMVVKDNVLLTYVNWCLVPSQLKEKMWNYTRVDSIT